MALFFISAFFYYYLIFTESRNPKYFISIVFFACAAINTRYPAFVIILIPFMHASYIFSKNFKLSIFIYSFLITILVFCPAYALNSYKPGSISGRLDFSQWSFGNYFKRSFITGDGKLSYLVPNIFYVFKNFIHPGYIFSGLLFLIFLRRNHFQKILVKIVILVVLIYALFLAGLQFQNDRVLLLTFPLVLIVFSAPFMHITERISALIPILKKLMIISVIIFQIVLFYAAFRSFYRDNVTTHDISVNMMKYPGKKIYTFNIDMALQGYGMKNETISLWSHKLDIFEPGALVLFNFTDSNIQWKGMNPMLNWESLNRDHHLKLLVSFRDGWHLYEITD